MTQNHNIEKFTITDEYFEYIKSTRNPFKWGMRDDGRFYPYSRPQGRLIGYGQQEFPKSCYAEGMSVEEAENYLRRELDNTLAALRDYMKLNYPDHHLDVLSRKSQEMLLDLAMSGGPENISGRLYTIIINEDWDTLFGEYLYIRWVEKGWPCSNANKAFADRWIDPMTRHLPGVVPVSILLNKGYDEALVK